MSNKLVVALLMLLSVFCTPILTRAVHAGDLGSILINLPGADWSAVRAEAQSQAGEEPLYKSNAVENKTFSGSFTAAAADTKVALLSDDGSSVFIDGQQVLGSKGQEQALDNLGESLNAINFTFEAGRTYNIRVEYSNVVVTGDADICGVTLFAYGSLGGYDGEARLTITFNRNEAPVESMVRGTVALIGPGTSSHPVIVTGPGSITPNQFTLRMNSSRTIRVTLPIEEGDHEYVAAPMDSSPQSQSNVGTMSPKILIPGAIVLGKAVIKGRKRNPNPRPTPTPRPTPRPRYFYHYTPVANIPGILANGLWPSIKDPSNPGDDARYGSGVYLTDLTPVEVATGTKSQHSYALFRVPGKWRNVQVGYIRINMRGLNINRVSSLYGQRFGYRGNFLHRRRTVLPLHGRIGGTGVVVYRPTTQE